MPEKLRRFLLFSVLGSLAVTLWAMVFGAASSTAIYLLLLVISPDRHNTFLSILSTGVGTMAMLAGPISALFFLGAGVLAPPKPNDLKRWIKLCVIRSLQGAFLLAVIGISITGLMETLFPSSPNDSITSPFPWIIYLIGGWAAGFFTGILWAVCEGIRRARKPNPLTNAPVISPPIAFP